MYTMTSFFYVVSYCHLSATLQDMNITVANLQDNRGVVQIFIAFLGFSFDSLSRISKMSHLRCVYINNRCGYQSITQQYLKKMFNKV